METNNKYSNIVYSLQWIVYRFWRLWPIHRAYPVYRCDNDAILAFLDENNYLLTI